MSTLLFVVELQIEIPRIAREVAAEHCRARLEEETHENERRELLVAARRDVDVGQRAGLHARDRALRLRT
jgi:hypothetical protein